jgi:hypothetical protein
MVISELRGAYPNVPIAADIDYTALITGDSEPVFLTIPIGKANVTSGNQRHYDEAWLQELERQTLAIKPIGLMGHLSDAQRATEFPPEAIHWVGAVREQDTLWGKGYVPPGPVRDRIRRYKAQGKALATSIDGFADGVWDEALGAYRMKADTLKLAQIDLAPADRAGIPALARVPALTKEMQDVPPTTNKEKVVDKVTVIKEMTAEDARLLPDPVRAAIVAGVAPAPEVAVVAGVREVLGLDAKADVVARVTELKQTLADQTQAAVTAKITELVNTGIKVEPVRPVVTELIVARKPQTVAEAESAYRAVTELASVTTLLASKVVETMGPPQRTPVQGKAATGAYFQVPKE